MSTMSEPAQRGLRPQRIRGGGTAEQSDKPMEEKEVGGRAIKVRDYSYLLLGNNGSNVRQTPLWFCTECGNMLYPKEDKASKSLKRVCRNCNHEDEADSNLVYVNDLRPNQQSLDAGSDMVKDPTLPHASGVECSGCGHDEAVFFQAPMKGDEAMKLIFMCVKCAHRWLQ